MDRDILKDAVRFKTIHIKTFLTEFLVQFEKPGLAFIIKVFQVLGTICKIENKTVSDPTEAEFLNSVCVY